jgi:riboflavin biosynthesis pyrimidine reductase
VWIHGIFLWVTVWKGPRYPQVARVGRGDPLGRRGDRIGVMRRIHPPPATDLSILEAYSADRHRHDDGRPWVGMCMVASIDGTTALGDSSGGLSNPSDSEVLLTLRDLADVIIVGAGTVRAEDYGPTRKPGQRIGVVTTSGNLDTGGPLFASGAGFVICPDTAPDLPVESLRVGHDRVDLAEAVNRLDDIVPDLSFVQLEGGASLNGAMLDADLIDEVNLTISPRLVGGTGPRLTTTELEHDARFELAHLLVDDELFVFTRWVRRRAC